jgi:hypothetical protein
VEEVASAFMMYLGLHVLIVEAAAYVSISVSEVYARTVTEGASANIRE